MSKQDIAQVFIEMHDEEHKYEMFKDECPLCDLLYEQVSQEFYDHIVETNTRILESYARRWHGRGYCIANKYDCHTSLGLEISDIIMSRITLRLPPHNFVPDDLLMHPYVIKKCKELTNAQKK